MNVNHSADIDNSPPPRPPGRPHSKPRIINWVPPPSASEFKAGLYNLYTNNDGLWVVHEWKTGRPGARIEPFYKRWPPSRTSQRGCAWIVVDRGGLSPALLDSPREVAQAKLKKDVEGLKAEFNDIVNKAEGCDEELEGGSSKVQVTPELIDELAVKYGVLSGKWMVHTKPEMVDTLWRKIVRVVAIDRGYGAVKVSARKVIEPDDADSLPRQHLDNFGKDRSKWEGGVPIPEEGHVICAYVDDYTNKREVDELRKALRERAGVFWNIGFKPDAYTHLGIYKGNRWSLRPSRYHDTDSGTEGRGFEKN